MTKNSINEDSSNCCVKHPNIIYIFADQLHGFGLGCLGSPDAHTPCLDALAARGTIIENAYSSAPVSTPARITMLTGLHAGTLGALANAAPIPPSTVTAAAAFRAAGYWTCYVGKWHIGATGNVPVPIHLRADFQGWAGYQCYNEFHKNVRFYDENDAPRDFEGRHRTDATFDIAIEKVECAVRGDRPFFLCVSEQAPHYPCQPDEKFLAPYRGRTMTMRPNTDPSFDPYTPTWSPRSPADKNDDTAYQAYGGDLQSYLRHYHAATSQLDAGIARLLAAVERLGIAEDTIIVFSSDHGDMQGSHGRGNKNLPYEESVRIPFIAAGPGIAAGARRKELIATVDFFPTFADLCSVPVPSNLHGVSRAALLRGETCPHPNRIFSEDASGWTLVREDNIKSVFRNGQLIEKYDLDTNPYEIKLPQF